MGVASQLRDQVMARFGGEKLGRRILFIRADEAPITRIQDKARAQVLMKLLNHPDTDRLLAAFQEMAGGDYPCKVYLEINPTSFA